MKDLRFYFLFFTLFLSAFLAFGQNKGPGFGIKGGLNYSTSGKYFQDAETIWKNPGASSGYHVGAFYKFGNYDLFLRPELVYSNTKFDTGLGTVKMQRMDAPVLVGLNFFKLISLVGGPSFHYSLKDNYSDFFENSPNKRLFLGYQFGLGFNVGPVGLDLRYERVFNDQKLTLDQFLKRKDNFRTEQIILGLSFQIK
ncbi:outer membrane beta-barrel protein [Algoriphagus aestuarii]|nr:outer membrane beta-barrel protein [Algoriphagus aestuarii]